MTTGGPNVSQSYYVYRRFRSGGPLPTDQSFTGQKFDRVPTGRGLYYYNSRYYDPQLGIFLRVPTGRDTLVPDATTLLAYNRYMYVLGNPMRLRDNSGHIWETVADVVSVGYDVYDIYNNGLTWSSGGALRADLAGVVLPFIPAPSTCLRWCDDALQYGDDALSYVGNKVDDAWQWGKEAIGLGDEAADVAKVVCSFSAETLVSTSEGFKPISELKAGDLVLAYNEETGETTYHPVSNAFAHNDPQLVFLTIDGETIITTPEHPFYEAEAAPWLEIGEYHDRWTPAEGLKAGDFVRNANGALGKVAKVQVVDRQQVMYNLTVAEAHTFFVGEEQWLVHNACSTKLRKAMGLTDPTKQAHHIVPGQLENHAFVQQAIGAGWNIDGAINGIALSIDDATALALGSVSHRGPHSSYTKVVQTHLDNLYTKAQKEGWAPQRIAQELNNLITNTLVPHIQSLPGTRLD